MNAKDGLDLQQSLLSRDRALSSDLEIRERVVAEKPSFTNRIGSHSAWNKATFGQSHRGMVTATKKPLKTRRKAKTRESKTSESRTSGKPASTIARQ
jgi:hypothetical protein